MSLRFIYGRAGSGKSRYCIESIKLNLDKGHENPLILVVPEQFSFQAEKSLLKKIKGTGIVNVEVTSFKRMAFDVLNEVGGATRQRMNSSGKLMLIFSIVNKLREKLKFFNKAADQRGFINTISDMITEFKRYDISPSELEISLKLIEDDELLRDKITDIIQIFYEFENTLHKNYIDSEDELTLLYKNADNSTMFDNAEIWIDEFNSFTPQQYKVIEKLFKKAKRVNITLCMDYYKEIDDTDVFAPIKKTENRILKLVEESGTYIDKPIILKNYKTDRFKNNEEIRYLESNYFKYPYKPYDKKSQDIKIIRSLNPYLEVENVSKEIIKFVREKGIRFRDIAVVSRDLSNYEKIVKTIFDEYEIPYFIDKKKEIDDNPLIVLITSVIDIFNKNWSYESVFRYLKTGLLSISKDEIDILENYVMAYGIRGRRKWSSIWKYGSEKNWDNINNIRLKVMIPLIKVNKKLQNKKNAKEICSLLYDFLCEIGAYETIENWVYKFKNDGNQALAKEYSQIWNIVMELLDQVVEVFKDNKIDLKEFVSILALGFGEQKMGLIPPSLDQVLVSDVERVRTNEVKLLYILGVNDGIFPSSLKEEGILSDADRDRLRKIGIEIAEDTKVKTFEEQFLIYKTLTITGKYLRICYPIGDLEGRALRPSIIISRIKDIFPKVEEENDIFDNKDRDLDLISREIPTFNKLVSVLRKNYKGKKVDRLWKDTYLWYVKNPKWTNRINTIFSAISYKNSVDQISREKVKKLYGNKLYVSVSRLEKYVECPFAYYVQYGLRARERKVFAIKPPDLGIFMHSVIDDFSTAVDKNFDNWYQVDKEWCEKVVSQIVDEKAEKISNGIFKSSPRYKYFTERLKRILIKTVLVIVEHLKRSGFRPIGYEIGFGDGESYPPIEIQLSNGEKVKLIGRIDRVDKLELEGKDYYRIIDYKSGSKDFKLSDVYYGLQIQLLTYLGAILTNENIKEKDPILPGGILYFKIDDPLIRASKNLSDEEIKKEIMKALKMKGLLLADTEVIKEMDREIEGSSLIIPAKINKNGELGQSSVGTEEQFKMLMEHVKQNLIKTCEEMLKGEIQIKPFKGKDSTACDYCIYSAVCQFDNDFDGNSYKIIKDKKDQEVWEMLDLENAEK